VALGGAQRLGGGSRAGEAREAKGLLLTLPLPPLPSLAA
jgi:hypothetical protein